MPCGVEKKKKRTRTLLNNINLIPLRKELGWEGGSGDKREGKYVYLWLIHNCHMAEIVKHSSSNQILKKQ